MTWAYYNEWEPYPAQWLRNLIATDLIPPGVVDERDVREVEPRDVANATQAHFFAGIGGWPYALRLVEWPDDRPVWTASLPCQPFSVAGRAHGVGDERHVWPAFRRLVEVCRPPVLVGEQVASKDGRLWLAGVRADLEALGYAVGAADLCAAGVGAPHIRQRLWWVADAKRRATERWGHDMAATPSRTEGEAPERERVRADVGPGSHSGGGLAHSRSDGREQGRAEPSGRGVTGGRGKSRVGHSQGKRREDESDDRAWPADSPWSGAVCLPCLDGKARRIESGLEPLVDGLPFQLADGRTVETASRLLLLHALGNSIVPQVAAEFVRAYMEVTR